MIVGGHWRCWGVQEQPQQTWFSSLWPMFSALPLVFAQSPLLDIQHKLLYSFLPTFCICTVGRLGLLKIPFGMQAKFVLSCQLYHVTHQTSTQRSDYIIWHLHFWTFGGELPQLVHWMWKIQSRISIPFSFLTLYPTLVLSEPLLCLQPTLTCWLSGVWHRVELSQGTSE